MERAQSWGLELVAPTVLARLVFPPLLQKRAPLRFNLRIGASPNRTAKSLQKLGAKMRNFCSPERTFA